jgi:hypothetical protein
VRWLAEKNGHQVQHVLPGTAVYLEADGAVVANEIIRVFEEPEPVVRSLLRKFGRDTRKPVAALRWDPLAAASAGAIRSGVSRPGQIGFDPTPSRYVAEVAGQRSSTLYVGAPVQITHTGTVGVEGGLSVPLLPAATIGATASREDRRSVSWTANGAVDPIVVLRPIGLGDTLFVSHWQSKLAQVRVRYEIRRPPLEEVFFEELRRRYPGSDEMGGDEVRLQIGEGESVQVGLPVYRLPPHGAPMVVAVFGTNERDILSVSELGVVVLFEIVL